MVCWLDQTEYTESDLLNDSYIVEDDLTWLVED